MTPKEKKYWIIGIVIIVIIIVVVLVKKKTKKIDQASTLNFATPVTIDENKKVVSTFPLMIGSKGPEVKKLQSWLLRNEGAQINVNGIWDQETDQAVKRLLKTDKISQDKYTAMGLK